MEQREFQRWTAKRKVERLLQLIRGEKKLVDVCREHDLKQSEVEGWMETFVAAGERGLKINAVDEQAVHEHELKELRVAAAGAGLSVTGDHPERALGYRHDVRVLWAGRLVSADRDHRLL